MIDTLQLPLITYIPMAEKLPNKIDLTRCMAFKSKSDKSQCPCRHRSGSRFCGKHAQTKQEILANGTKRSNNRTLLAQSTQTHLNKQVNKSILQQSTKQNTQQNTLQKNTQNNEPIMLNKNKQITNKNKQITHYVLRKDAYLSKLTSQQINDNFLFYQLNKYLHPTNTKSKNNTNININLKTHELTTEQKRQSLYKLFTLLFRIDQLDPTHKKIIKLQRLIRKHKYRIRQWNRGKGAIYPSIQCTNKDDFCSLDPLDTIPQRLLFTYKDTNGFIYGFNLLSFLDLIANSEQPLNPYTRCPISRNVINRANKYHRILTNWSKVDEPNVLEQQRLPNTDISIVADNGGNNGSNTHGSIALRNAPRLSFKDRTKQRLQSVFQKINYLGYQTNIDWLLDKSAPVLISFIKTLAKNWSYQLGFSDTTKQSLLSHQDLHFFETLVNDAYRNPQLVHSSTLHIMNRILGVLEPLINNTTDPNSAALLVLYSLYYIDPRRVSNANPWMN
jgi:hypothetical protein